MLNPVILNSNMEKLYHVQQLWDNAEFAGIGDPCKQMHFLHKITLLWLLLCYICKEAALHLVLPNLLRTQLQLSNISTSISICSSYKREQGSKNLKPDATFYALLTQVSAERRRFRNKWQTRRRDQPNGLSNKGEKTSDVVLKLYPGWRTHCAF